MDNVYISNGVEQYFLGNLPHWINFSGWAKCQREEPIRYMNFEVLNRSYGLKYYQMVHMQHMWNRKIYAYRRSGGAGNLPLKDEAFIFNNVYAQVIGGSHEFIVPKFKKVSLIWIDEFLNNKGRLRQILNREDVLAGHPVLVTHCLTSYATESLIQELNLEELGAKIISAEMFGLYSSDIKMGQQFGLDVSQILKKKEITLFSKTKPKGIWGINKHKKIE